MGYCSKSVFNPFKPVFKPNSYNLVNGCCVEVFAVEVVAMGYCSKPVLCCFKKLGFQNTLIWKTIQKIKQIFYGMPFLYLVGKKY